MLKNITPSDAFAKLQAGEAKLIDIRDTSEYAEVFIPGAHLVPLSIIARHPLQEAGSKPKELIFTCRSGKRTEAAQPQLEKVVDGDAYILEGGLQGWEKAHLPVERLHNAPLPMFRQIQIAAGSLVLLGVVGSALWHPFFWLSAFVGAGLVFAGISGFCGIGLVLAKMPWNKQRP